MDKAFLVYLLPFLSSALVCFLIIRWGILRSLAYDPVGGGPQKFYSHPVPRVGGIGVMAGLLFPAFYFYNTPYIADYLLVLLCSLPAFAGGLVEDFTKRAGVKTRLILTMLSEGDTHQR